MIITVLRTGPGPCESQAGILSPDLEHLDLGNYTSFT